MLLRKAGPGDLADLEDLESRIFSADSFAMSRRCLLYHLRGENIFWLARSGQNRLAGYILVFLRANSPQARIYSLAVDPDFRRENVASRLLSAAIGALPAKISRLSLEVREDNQAAIWFYRKHHFQNKKVLPAYYPDGCGGLQMIYELPSSGSSLSSGSGLSLKK